MEVTKALSYLAPRCLRALAFASPFGSPRPYTPWLLLQEEWQNTDHRASPDPLESWLLRASFLPRSAFISPPSFRSFQPHACVFFSAFPRGTCSLSVYSLYLGLGFDAPIFAPRTRAVLLACGNAHRTSPTRLSLSMTALSNAFGSCPGSNATPHLHAFCKAGFGAPCAAFIRITRRIDMLFLLLRVLRYFNSPRSRAIASTIRSSRVQSPTCGYPGLIAACHDLHRGYSQAIP